MIYGFSPHTAEMVELLLERGLSCLRRGCDCDAQRIATSIKRLEGKR